MILNQTGGTQFSAHCLRGAVIGRLEERWVQQGKPKLARRSFYLNQEKKSVLGTKPWSFWAEVLLKSPDHVQAPSCWLNQLTMALNWTYRAFCRELASARGAASESSLILDVFPSWAVCIKIKIRKELFIGNGSQNTNITKLNAQNSSFVPDCNDPL